MDTVIDDLILAFECGSQQGLGRLLQTDGKTVWSWKSGNKIPIRRIVQIEALAEQKGVRLPPSFYEHKEQVWTAAALAATG